MKHLNPRQGITTVLPTGHHRRHRYQSVKHLNPRQGITTDAKGNFIGMEKAACETPKSPPGDYNHRRGNYETPAADPRVKHLNPRQGITTQHRCSRNRCRRQKCETPKSPPGDYNKTVTLGDTLSDAMCETPKSPPGDYNPRAFSSSQHAPISCVKHLNPRQGITTDSDS